MSARQQETAMAEHGGQFVNLLQGLNDWQDGSLEQISGTLQSAVKRTLDREFRERSGWAAVMPHLLAVLHRGFVVGDGESFCRIPEDRSFRVMLLVTKLLRNLCAGVTGNQKAFRESKGVETFGRIAQALLVTGGDGGPVLEFLALVLQLLGNFVTGGEENQAAVWREWFPDLFHSFSQLDEARVYDPLCMLLFTCCRGSEVRSRELCEAGHLLLAPLLNFAEEHLGYGGFDTPAAAEHAEGGVQEAGVGGMVLFADVEGSKREVHDWLELLLTHLCLEQPFLAQVFGSLGPAVVSDLGSSFDTASFGKNQAILLGSLCSILHDRAEELLQARSDTSGITHDTDAVPPLHVESVTFLVDLARVGGQGRHFAAGDDTATAADVLRFGLFFLRMICSWEADGASLKEWRSNTLGQLLSHGLLKLMLDMLEALGPPETVKAKSTATVSELEDCSGSSSLSEFAQKNPYPGYRRDIVAVIANMCFRNPQAQDTIRDNGGLTLVLQQCVVDKENPFLREWGFWAMRNILLENEKNQREVASLEVQGSVNTEEVHNMGFSVEMDPITRRPKLVNLTPENNAL